VLLVQYRGQRLLGSPVGSGLKGTTAILGAVVVAMMLAGLVGMYWPRHQRHQVVREAVRFLRRFNRR
jgi:hypothetical protein